MLRFSWIGCAVCVLALWLSVTAGAQSSPSRQQIEKQAESLKIKFLVNPGDKKLAARLFAIYLIDLDDPISAKEYAQAMGNPTLVDNTKLATKSASDLSLSEAVILAEWYRQHAAKAAKHARKGMLIRTYVYYQQYLDNDKTRGSAWKRVQTSMRSVRHQLHTMGVDTVQLTLQKAKAEAAVKSLGKSVSFTAPGDAKGLSTVSAPEGAFSKTNIAGTSALRASSGIYFDVGAGFAQGLPADRQRVFVQMSVLDEKAGQLRVEYDGRTAAGVGSLTGSGKWKDLAIELPGATFGGQLSGGADLAIKTQGGAALILKKISVVRADVDTKAQSTGRDVDLLKLVDARHDAVAGTWQLRTDGLRNRSSPNARIIFPLQVTGSYTLKIKAARVSGKGPINVIFPAGKSHGMLIFGSASDNKAFFGMELIGGKAAPTRSNTAFEFLEQKIYLFEIRVNVSGGNVGVSVKIDGGSSGGAGASMSGTNSTFSLKPAWQLPHKSMPGLAAHNTVIHCQSATISVLAGQPKQLALVGRAGPSGGPGGPEDTVAATRGNSQIRSGGVGFGSALDAKKDLGIAGRDNGTVNPDDPSGGNRPTEPAKPDGDTLGNRGSTWTFNWPSTKGATAYRLQVFGPKSPRPLMNVVVKNTAYQRIQRGVIPTANRKGWTWRFQAIVKGKAQAWSKKYRFEVAPYKK